jgi:hypothetical protein
MMRSLTRPFLPPTIPKVQFQLGLSPLQSMAIALLSDRVTDKTLRRQRLDVERAPAAQYNQVVAPA